VWQRPHERLQPAGHLAKVVPLVPDDAQQIAYASKIVAPVVVKVCNQLRFDALAPVLRKKEWYCQTKSQSDLSVMLNVHASCSVFTHHAQCSRIMLNVPASCSMFPHHAQCSRIMLNIHASCSMFTHHAQCSRVMLNIPASCSMFTPHNVVVCSSAFSKGKHCESDALLHNA